MFFLSKANAGAAVALIVVCLVFLSQYVNFSIPPFEDAAILMRYAVHLAAGQGIVWNPGDTPVDGATDFLFMVMAAGLHATGLSIEHAVRSISISAQVGTVLLIFFGMRRVQGAGVIPAFLTAMYFAVGPGFFLAAAYFGTPLFVLFVALSWLLAQQLFIAETLSKENYCLFALACLLAGLVRPEGVLLGIFMLCGVRVMVPASEFRKLLQIFSLVFVCLGGAYFFWHWHYFGYPLPNPYYKKGAWQLYPGSLRDSVLVSMHLLYPVLPAFLLALRNQITRRLLVAFLLPLLGSIVMWALLSNEMNFGGRFQYPTLVIGLLCWYPLVRTLHADFHLPVLSSLQKIACIAVAAIYVSVALTREISHAVRISYTSDSRYDVAKLLHDYADRDYTLATTEAGLLPLYSGWRSLDTWGLNDAWIAHHDGLITMDYLAAAKPDLVVYRKGDGFVDEKSSGINPARWSQQIAVLEKYVRDHNFVLATQTADGLFYFVGSDTPDTNEIVRRIREITAHRPESL
jgi:hypothetical protein